VLLEDQYTIQWGHHNAEREKKRKTEPKEQTTPNKKHTHQTNQNKQKPKTTSGIEKLTRLAQWGDNDFCIIKRIGMARNKSNRTRNENNIAIRQRPVREATQL
jgi:hypothetical protein